MDSEAMAAAAAAAATKAAARDASDAAAQAELLGREAALAAAVSSMAGGDGMLGVEPEDGISGDQQERQAYADAMDQAMGMGDEENMEHLLQQMQMQEGGNLQEQLEAQAAMMARPDEHFLTIALTGTILGATETVTGFPPSSLLMTSVYESVHEEDLLGLFAVKSHFWERDQPDVEVYLRRRNIEEEWVWLVAKVVSYIDSPVPGIIIHEVRAPDEEAAEMISRTTRISALLVQAVESACIEKKETEAGVSDGSNANAMAPPDAQEIPGVADDNDAIRTLLANAADTMGVDLSNSSNPLRELIEAAAKGGTAMHTEPTVNNGTNANNSSLFDAIIVGSSIDMTKVVLSPPEIKLATLVLTGRLPIEELGPLIYTAMNAPGRDLGAALSGILTDMERKEIAAQRSSPARVGRRRSYTDRSRGLKETSPQAGIPSWNHNRSVSEPPVSASRPQHRFLNSLGDYNTTDSRELLEAPAEPSQTLAIPPSLKPLHPPPLAVINLSFTDIGNDGMDMLSEILYVDNASLKTLDLGFCGLGERGILSLCRGLWKRKKRGLPCLQGLIISGNTISYKAASELGLALSSEADKKNTFRTGSFSQFSDEGDAAGYDEDDEYEGYEEEEDEKDALFGTTGGSKRESADSFGDRKMYGEEAEGGLQLLHLGCTSIKSESLHQLLLGLGQNCPIQELRIPSNDIGPTGATLLVDFLEGKGISKFVKGLPVMPNLDRLDMSNNNLGNDGTARLTRAISKRVKVNIADLRLSSNSIGATGIETIMNKLLQHNLWTLHLDNNMIGDRGCQLVAASLPSMHHLSRLNLGFNQIGSRGVTTLMRSIIGCESITYVGLSGNVMQISGAISMGFALAQHPRLEEIELDNCCLSQVAQCHIVAGIISNRWVPIKRMLGFRAGPPMVAIGALEVLAQHLSNEECFQIRRDIQMKTILQWMESNRAAQMQAGMNTDANMDENFLTADFISSMNDVNGAPSQSAYLRMLDWLSRIPFDEDELTDLRRYFYDIDGGDDARDGDGNLNLKHRGDLLAALGSDMMEEIRDADPPPPVNGSVVGLDLESTESTGRENSVVFGAWKSMDNLRKSALIRGSASISRSVEDEVNVTNQNQKVEEDHAMKTETVPPLNEVMSSNKRRRQYSQSGLYQSQSGGSLDMQGRTTGDGDDIMGDVQQPKVHNDDAFSNRRLSVTSMDAHSSVSSLSRQSVTSQLSTNSKGERRSESAVKARITMFPQFAAKLDMLKATAQEMMDHEEDPDQQDVIAQQFAEASLTLLRQLRYHCMNNGLDGWRQGQGTTRRKVLIVDDSKVTRKMVSRAFEKANFIVDTAENGIDGLAKLKESIYDIAFMDIDMPVMNGFDATKALRDWEDLKRPGARQPICALTAAYVDDFERSELMKFKDAGLDVMESKPCNIPRLFKVVDDVSPMFSDLSISVTQYDSTTGT